MTRPTAVTVIGVLGIVFSVLGLCCSIFGGLGLAAVLGMGEALTAQAGAESPELSALNSPTFRIYTLVSLVIGIVFGVWLLIGSIMLLRMLPIGWSLMVAYAAVAILWSIVDTVLTLTVLSNVAAVAGAGRLFGFVIGLIYPIAVLIVLTRPTIKQAFQQQGI